MSQSKEITVGDIVKDIDFEEEYFIVVDKYIDVENNTAYELRSLKDFSRKAFPLQEHLQEWYEVVS